MSLGTLFSAPYRESNASYTAGSTLYPVSLDGVGYLVDLRPAQGYRRASLDVLEARPNRTKGQMALTPADVWWEIRESWHAGSGQRTADRQDSMPDRFETSIGVDPWEMWELSLLHDTEKVLATSALDGHVHLATVGKLSGETYTPWLIAAVDDTLHWTDDISLGAATVWQTQNLGSQILSMVSDGEAVITAHADGTIRRSVNPTTSITLSTKPGVDFVGYAKGHVIAGVDSQLWDITYDTQIGTTNPLQGWRWRAVSEGNSVIYALGGIGDRWMIHRISVEVASDGTTNDVLGPPVVAVQLPDGEIGLSLGTYLGFVAVGTDKGFRLGMSEASGDVTLGRNVPTPGPVYAFEGQDRFVWYTNTNFATNHSGLGRMDLTTFTAPLTPAYANDLDAQVEGTAFDVVTFNGERVFSISGQGVFAESVNLVESGWVEQGSFTWGTMDNKIALYAQVKHKPLAGRVETLVAYDESDWISAYVSSTPGSTGGKNQYLQGQVFSTVRLRLQLARDDTDPKAGPHVTRSEIRVYPNSGRASEWVIPIILWDSLEVEGTIQNRNPRADLDRLISMVESGRVVAYREGNRGWQVNATAYEWRPEKQSMYEGWQGVFTLRLREVR